MSRIDYSRIDVVDFLNELGIRNVFDEGVEVKYSCPFEGHSHGDSTPSATMEKGTTRAHCFGCGWSGNALSFLYEYEDVSPLKAARWIRERWGAAFRDTEGSFTDEINRQLEEQAQQAKPPEPMPILDEKEADERSVDWTHVWSKAALNEAPEPFRYMLDRGFLPHTLTAWDIGFDILSNRITLPARNHRRELVGFKGRSWHPDDRPKYKVLGGKGYNFEPYEVSRVLFGIHMLNFRGEVREHDIIVVEGELNAIAMHQHGYTTTVGISGKTLSRHQCEEIRKIGEKVLLIFDEEDDAQRAANKLIMHMPVLIAPQRDKDPADMTYSEIEERVNSARPAL